MKKIVKYEFNDKEKEAIKNVVQTITCNCECQDHNPCPFLMETGGCMIEALDEILKDSE
jgi:hypothetical protein